MKRTALALAGVAAVATTAFLAASVLPWRPSHAAPLTQLKERFAKKARPSIDHAQLDRLKQPFAKPQDVTAACISCHNGRGTEVMHSSHWEWQRTEYVQGKGVRTIGKRNVLNNFCIGIASNETSCTKCHAGYGYSDSKFDFNNALNVDCLACHDTTGKYAKANGGSGMPDAAVDLTFVAQHVGKTTRANCISCHGLGGGGNNVKHGDLEVAMISPERSVDVHMSEDGSNLQCVSCHTTENHQISGKLYSVSSMNRNRATCESCHGEVPHQDSVINKHTLKVACQTCHIPTYAKVRPTKLRWDWSTAGRLRDGKPYEEKNEDGVDTYMSIKGSFVWGKNIKPEYAWSNGTASHYLLGDKVEPGKVVKMNELFGSYQDPEAKIIPVKIHRGKQIYDTENKYLIQPKTVSTTAGDGGYWKEFNWDRAAEEGMKAVGLPWSGHTGFIETEMVWPVNHMVSPKGQTVGCAECHVREGGRLAALGGFYIPGRDSNLWIERLGKLVLLLTFAGVVVHGGARIVISRRRKGGK
jgi:octaheme c-type cytochrome (tetrathionate reductase family)